MTNTLLFCFSKFRYRMTRPALTVILSMLLGACSHQPRIESIPQPPAVAASTLPCWLQHPVNEKSFGQFGIARNIDAGIKSPLVMSRQRAAAAIGDYLAPDLNLDEQLKQIDDETESLSLAGQTVSFTNKVDLGGYLYSYASLASNKNDETQVCQVSQCDIKVCDPEWLCSPSTRDQIAMLGVSYRATSPVEQHYHAIENALLQAEYLYGVNVVAHKGLAQSQSDYFRYSVLKQQGQVDTGNQESLSYAVTDRCYAEGTLFSRVALYGVNPADRNDQVRQLAFEHWFNNPKYLGFDGAVGAVQRGVASGLISDQIKLAIKRAAIQLAFEKQSQVSEELVNISYQSGNSLLLSYITEDTRVDLKARVLGIHFAGEHGNQLQVFAWVARID